MDAIFSNSLTKIISYSREEAARLRSPFISVEHLFLGILREPSGVVGELLSPVQPYLKDIKLLIEQDLSKTNRPIVTVDDKSATPSPLDTSAERALQMAFLTSIKFQTGEINPEHLLLAILRIEDETLNSVLQKFNYSYNDAAKLMTKISKTSIGDKHPVRKKQKPKNDEDDLGPENEFDFSDDVNEVDDTVNMFTGNRNKPTKFDDNDLYDLYNQNNNGDEDFDDFYNDDDDDDDDDFDDDFDDEELFGYKKDKSKKFKLSDFGSDITAEAAAGKLDIIVGRDKELERMSQILSRRKKNNPIIIGESGVGKSAMIEGLALRIAEKKTPRNLYNKKIFSIDVASIVAGTKYRGDFEKRIKAIINEAKQDKNIILFIDEIHTLIGAGNASGSIDASSIFKPALAKGEIQCIGTTTFDEYRQYLEKDVAFERRFQKVVIEPTSCEDTIEILNSIKGKYEEHHHVKFSEEAVNACVLLTNRYITDRFLPDKAIDAMDEAGSRVHIKHSSVVYKEIADNEAALATILSKKQVAVQEKRFEDAGKLYTKEKKINQTINNLWEKDKKSSKENPDIVKEENVAEVVSMMTGIPMNKISSNETNRLINLEKELTTKVVGQDEAVSKIAKAIRRNRAGLKNPNKPIGSFIFLGQTGVGKTYLAKTLAETMFDSADSLIRIDMGEYVEKFSVSRLIGAPPGYVGYEEGGQLTEMVRRKPYSVVLLDEIEKAHPDVYNVMLQMLDYGVMTDGLGRKVDFRNTIIIMTSNIGSRQAKEFGGGVGFNSHKNDNISENTKAIIDKALKKNFSPEFLNRIDEVINFNTLSKDDIKKIIAIEIAGIAARMKEINMELTVTDELINYIIDNEWDIQYGARPLHRAIQRFIEDPVSEAVIQLNPERDKASVIVDYVDTKPEVILKKV
ncbi:MAG: ATP-dependent Clp protease ATP-binding subunit [Bacteroidales bacterium]|nr:ATP-dependent Clp protease ATP-binding subunit [Bacteroidales bacterium]MDD3152030.1 ATP-dependent Clp protease ATP-binding subunit [Bacteroidales bacterium]MDD3914476.1 ATP-dependent Clp protease ATP-binding subunit [Bacteroidales bacterium]MDD4634304.1 ATP-dependent Clp protease ATP-binding subunit [Bacteroidales bacterium]